MKKGFRFSEEYKQHIRIAKRTRGYKGPMYGKKHSEKTKAARSKAAIEKEHHLHFPNNICPETGKWKGGCDLYLKRMARKRDDFTCQVCGMRDEEIMQVDHIKPKALYPELALVLENMQTLCPNCHARKTIREKKEIFRVKRESKAPCG